MSKHSKMGLRLRPREQPDEVDLEFEVLGLLDERLDIEDLDEQARALLDELYERRQAWENAPPLPHLKIRPRAMTPSWVYAAAAVVMAGIFVLYTPPRFQNNAQEWSMKGTPPVELTIRRAGQIVPPMRGAFVEGDLLGMALRVPERSWITVALVDSEASVEVLWSSPPDQASAAGSLFELDGSVELDDNESKEWLVLILADEPIDIEALTERLVEEMERGGQGDRHSWWFNVSRIER